MKKVKVAVGGRVEEIDRNIYEYVQKMSEIERRIRSLASSEMPIEDALKELDQLHKNTIEDDSGWEDSVTCITHEIRERCNEIDGHVASSIDGN